MLSETDADKDGMTVLPFPTIIYSVTGCKNRSLSRNLETRWMNTVNIDGHTLSFCTV